MTQDTYVAQVGGKHYRVEGDAPQHWDVVEKYDIDYLTGQASKYLMRWRKKGTPKLDLGKSASFIEKALACRPGRGALRLASEHDVDAMCVGARTHWMDAELVKALLCSGSRADFEATLARVREMEEGTA